MEVSPCSVKERASGIPVESPIPKISNVSSFADGDLRPPSDNFGSTLVNPILKLQCPTDIDVILDPLDNAVKSDSLLIDKKNLQPKPQTVPSTQKWKRRARDPRTFAIASEETGSSLCGLKRPPDDVSLSFGDQKKGRSSSYLHIPSATSHDVPTAEAALQPRQIL